METVLVIEGDSVLTNMLRKSLAEGGYKVLTASSGQRGLSMIRSASPDLVLLDVQLPDMDGVKAYERIKAIDPDLCTVIMTDFRSTDIAIKAFRMGAFEYILKPFNIGEMLGLIEDALEAGRLLHSKTEMPDGLAMSGGIAMIGRSKHMLELYRAIKRVAATNVTVLIRGESGTGKDLVSRAIHCFSHRKNKPFQVIDCVAIPENLLESELFGYEKGAFTGAGSRHAGKIDMAEGGSVFLDEIGDMPLGLQAKILRFLQEKKYCPLGGNALRSADVRIIAATNCDLEKALADKQFREDLYYRLKVVTIWVPPLRDHIKDIPLLAEHFLNRYAEEFGISNPVIDTEALSELARYAWPGNVRELSNILQKALIFSRRGRISSAVISIAMREHGDNDGRTGTRFEEVPNDWIRHFLETADASNRFALLMDQCGRQIISAALDMTKGNRTRAAKLLGISRQALIARMGKRLMHSL